MMRYYKTVLLPITVSAGDYCWEHHTADCNNGIARVCSHLINDGGVPKCELGIGDLEYDRHGRVPKPQKCLELIDGRDLTNVK